ncbi:hypothetical protein [Natrinema salifodinae]|uniref:Lipoprotein n=1 Tax=Natrinema salifodinae TaxID=1202768 RepID=A0A1I0M7H2_9EURY|nr:hypothetical protein [Natrinema salifodinae]SEV84068.1 hypothetical protein SAMN05216285_0567 [Natrinema salifodinae]
MERRKILLGTGAGLITVLAGCSGGDQTSDDEETTGPDEKGETEENDTETENGDETDEDKDKDDEHDETKGKRDVPGIDEAVLEEQLAQRGIHLETFRRNNSTLAVEVSVSGLDANALSSDRSDEELKQRLSAILQAATDAVTDPRAFIAAIETITVTILGEDHKKGTKKTGGLTLDVHVDWLLQFMRNDLPEDELIQRAMETAADDG